jgi:hypothetical protein
MNEPTQPSPIPPARVTVVDFDMPFWSIVLLLVKWAIAAIPAALILFIVAGMMFAGVGALGLLAGLGSMATRAALNTTGSGVSEGAPLVVTIRPNANGLEIRNDTDETWSGCSVTVHGRGGSIGAIAAHATTVTPVADATTIDESAVVVHCLKPRDHDARVYFVR